MVSKVDKALNEYLSVQEDIIESIFRKDGVEEYTDASMNRKERFRVMDKYVDARWWLFVHQN